MLCILWLHPLAEPTLLFEGNEIPKVFIWWDIIFNGFSAALEA